MRKAKKSESKKILEVIKRKHVLKAIKTIREKGNQWLEDKGYAKRLHNLTHFVDYEEEYFPVKALGRVAYKIATGKRLKGGWEYVNTIHFDERFRLCKFSVVKVEPTSDEKDLVKLVKVARHMARKTGKTAGGNMTQTFTNAIDEGVINMIQIARHRLVVIAPAVTTPVAKALADRMTDLPHLKITVILDADPEVYRMGYGEPESLEAIGNMSEDPRIDLREEAGIRIGVVTSDDREMIFAPVNRNVEAGSIAFKRLNAIISDDEREAGLSGSDSDVASGSEIPETDPEREASSFREIGQNVLDPSKIEEMKEDLEANPPALARLQPLFAPAVQFVELRMKKAILSSKTRQLPTYFRKYEDPELHQNIKSLLTMPINLTDKICVIFESYRGTLMPPNANGKEGQKKLESLSISEADLKLERTKIGKKFLHNWENRGKVILKKRKVMFKQEIDRLLSMTNAYHTALKDHVAQRRDNFREKIVAEFFESWKTNPPDRFKRDGDWTETRCITTLRLEADKLFDNVVTLGESGADVVYKDISAEDLENRELMASLQALIKGARPGV